MQMRMLSQEVRTVGNFHIQIHILIICVLKFNLFFSNAKETALENANEETVEALIDTNEDVLSHGRQLLHSKSCLDHLFLKI